MTTATANGTHAATSPTISVVYRDGSGSVDTDLPPGSIREALLDADGALWVDIEDRQGHGSREVEALFREVFNFHPLAIEDALCDSNVAKIDDWDRYLYLIFHSIEFEPDDDEITPRDLDIFLGPNYLVTYRSAPNTAISKIRALVDRDPETRLGRGVDHVLYLILDVGIGDHLAAIEHLDAAIDEAQEEIFDDPTPETLQKIIRVKHAVARLNRLIAPQREVVARLARDDYPQVSEKQRVYFRDVYDGLVRLHDVAENVRDLVGAALETYLSIVSNRTNDNMKALTIVTVLFLPLNFIVGFFGMNFFGENIELGEIASSHGAVFLGGMAAMICSAFGLWLVGRRLGWY